MIHGKTWRGLDTETVDGRAVLVCTDVRSLTAPKSFNAIMEWLLCQGKKFWAWNADYDVRAICSFLPAAAKEALSYGLDAEYRGWKLEYIPHKRFAGQIGSAKLEIYDAMQFYGAGLESASQKWLGEGKSEVPRDWLSNLAPHMADPASREKITRYCVRDASLCLRLGMRLTTSLDQIGIRSQNPMSPATLAAQVFAAPTTPVTAEADISAQSAFYGGRIELWRRGFFRENLGLWDIRSAYPAVAAALVDPGPARRVKSISKSARYGIYKLAIRTSEPCLPYRRHDGLVYPVGEWIGWYARPHALLARDFGSVRVLDGWEFSGIGDPLYPDIPRFYAARKLNPDLALAYKLIINGWYGKLAERTPEWVPARRVTVDCAYVGGRFLRLHEKRGRHTNFVLASEITAETQSRVYRAAKQVKNLVAIATDSIIAPTAGASIVCGDKLGDWDGPKRYETALFISPGVYDLGGQFSERKQGKRGLKLPEGASLFDLLVKSPEAESIEVPCRHAATMVECRRRGDWKKLNAMSDTVKHVALRADMRRDWDSDFACAGDVLAGNVSSRPVVVMEGL